MPYQFLSYLDKKRNTQDLSKEVMEPRLPVRFYCAYELPFSYLQPRMCIFRKIVQHVFQNLYPFISITNFDGKTLLEACIVFQLMQI